MMDAKYESLGVFKQVVKTSNDYPADSYGKVVLCGNSGAGKSTLTQVKRVLYGMAFMKRKADVQCSHHYMHLYVQAPLFFSTG